MTWQTKKLGEICDFEGGSQPPKSNFIFLPRKGYVRFLQIRDFKSDKNITYIPEAKKNRLCNKGDVLIGRYGASVGQILSGEEGAYNVALMKTIPNLNTIDKKYFFYYLISFEFQDRLLKVSSRSAQNGFSKNDIFNFPVLITTLLEQKRIVKILDDAFEKIERAKENTEKNLQNSKELFESYLHGIFAKPKKNWEEKTLEEVCEALCAGGDVPKKRFSKTKTDKYSVPIFANGEKNKGLFGYTDIKKITKPSITISARGTIGYSEIRETDFYPVVRLIVLTPNTNIIDLNFLSYAVRNIKFLNTGSSIPQLTIPMVQKYKFFSPAILEQKTIIKKLDALSKRTKKLEEIYKKKLNDLEELKKSVLNKAFTGEL
ncbi:MAG: restriction endonuclease subunit S [bacterium]|nr:restriction endonuclease subunit S [bacterium]